MNSQVGHLVCGLLLLGSSGTPSLSILYSHMVPQGGSWSLLMESLKYITPFLLFQSNPFGICTPSGPKSCRHINQESSAHIVLLRLAFLCVWFSGLSAPCICIIPCLSTSYGNQSFTLNSRLGQQNALHLMLQIVSHCTSHSPHALQ